MLRSLAALAALLGSVWTPPLPAKAAPIETAPPYPRGASDPGTPLRAYPAAPAAGSPGAARALAADEVEGVDATDVALAVPRLALLPVRALLLLLVPPVEGAVALNERYRLKPRVDAALHTDDGDAGIVPTGSFITDFGATVGVRAFHRDAFGHGERLGLSLELGDSTRQQYTLTFGAEHIAHAPVWLRTRLEYEEEPNEPFSGLGDPERAERPAAGGLAPTAGSVDTRFARDTFSVAAGAGPLVESGPFTLRPGAHVRFARHSFGAAESDGPSIEGVYDVTALRGFERTARVLEASGSLSLQSALGDGPGRFTLEGFGGRALAPGDFEYWRWGAETSLRLDLSNEMRLLRLGVGVAGVSDDAPFFALPALGGADRLRGYLTDRFRDTTAVLATLDYQWYVGAHVQGLAFVEAGRVAADPFGGGRWHPSGGFGVLLGDGDESLFRGLVAYGDGLRFYLSADFGGLVRLRGAAP